MGVLAFESVDTLPWPSTGAFPAYDAEGGGLPTTFSLRGGIMFDNNVLRRETSRESDTITRAGIGFRHEQRVVGRQRLIVDARGDVYYFDHFTDLTHFAYAVLGDWRWEVGNDFSGSIILGRDRRQVDLGEAVSLVRDPVTTTRVGASAAYTGVPDWRLRVGTTAARSERGSRDDAELRAGAVSLGLDWVSPLRNTLGVEYRHTWGDAPVPEFVPELGAFVDNDFREKEIAGVATYAPVPQIRMAARLGRTERTYSAIEGRDFNGTTGRFVLDWLPGNKTILGIEAYRAPQSIIDVAAGHTLVSGIAFVPRWAVTNKVVLSSRLSRERRRFEGDPATTAGAPVRDEVITLIRLAVGWEPQRHWQLSAGLDRGERESNEAGRDYRFNAVVFHAQWNY